jgi:hypothetical protein
MIASGNDQLSYNAESSRRKNVNRAIAGEPLLQSDLRPFCREAGGQNFFGETLNCGEGVASARPRCRLPTEIGRGEHVVTSNLVGAAHFLYR